MKKVIFILILIASTLNVYSQEKSDTTLKQPKIQVKAAYMGDSVIIRWAPDNTEGWVIGNINGYMVERLEINKNHEPVSEWKNLTEEPLKPYSISRWKSIFAKDSSDVYAMMAAESLYGKYQGKGQEIKIKSAAEIMLEAQDFEERFTICLLSSDLSSLGAQGMGWRWCDKTAEKSKIYIYNVYCPQPDSAKVRMENTSVEVNTVKAYNPVPIITKFEEKEKQVDLLLDRDFHQKNFTAFYFEKSTDGGKTFKRMNKAPYFNPESDQPGIGNKDYIVFTDTFDQNYIPAWYRVVGITPFATLSPYSDTIFAMGRDRTPPPAPDSIKAVMLENGTMKIEWVYKNPVADLNGFLIGRSKKPYKNFNLLFEKPLPANTREFIDTSPNTLAPNYYSIFAIDTAGNASMAKAVYGHYIDSIPPSPPLGLTGSIDSNGIVTLKWKMGSEIDLLGYHVYFANDSTHYWANVSNNVLQDTVFTDTITLKSLTEKIYYRVTALDYNYNVSNFSKILELHKPDFIPPAAPTLVRWENTENSVKLIYHKSHSKDVESYKLLRKNDKNQWDTIGFFTKKEIPDTLVDKDLKPYTKYTYALVAIDDAGNTSDIAYELTVRTKAVLPKGDITSFDIEKKDKNILISWQYKGNNTDRIFIYRAEPGMKFKLMKSVNAAKTQYTDKHTKENKTYRYRLIAETKNGLNLDYTEEKTIKRE